MRVAYLVNQYPKVSHTFIRREIQALEALGATVVRYSIRRVAEELKDEADQRELKKTRFVLDGGAQGLASAIAMMAATRPVAFARASAMASRIGVGSERGLAIHGAYLGEACVLARWMEADKIDHVHAHFGTNPTTVAMLIHELGGPGYSFHVHGPEEFDKPLQISLGEKIERSRFVCGISSFGRSQLYRQVRYEHWPKVEIVRCGVDPSFLSEGSHPFPKAPELVSVGRLSEQKGQMLMLEALGRLHKKGRDFHLTLVGDGELRGEVEALIKREDLGDKVTITGWASGEEVRNYILGARAMILPSFAEGLPVVLMESLGLGRPALSTYVAGIPELIQPGETGWLVPAGSVDALVSGIEAVLDTDDSTLEAMGARGQVAVRERHDASKNGADLKALIERALG